ncbi:glycoside hydrolase family 127 protein [Rathayibacter festucae]|uniref:glycoside hydrolase family 127 protein n=1 Tax=Rathayibacter festucae TaxID=110937 RepID=UPI001FB2AE47|nr:beta-L-arabinofuranosidase domain-containing protein [Rathayibacter festucae]MCJ1701800.1 glycoside hydrolase family 127 protein [Rathayibacter festucae]
MTIDTHPRTPSSHDRDTLSRTMAPAVPAAGALTPLGLDEVELTSGFWADRQRTNGSATLDHIEYWLEREGWLPNFDHAAAGTLAGHRTGREFADSEIYKYLEALAWEIGRTDDPALELRLRHIVSRVGAAQEPDGYLNTRFGREEQAKRWSDLEWGHELYCLGHLFQAAVARERTRPGADDGLLVIARRAADLICLVFGEGGIESVCGHPEVETGLVELSRVTDDDRYLELARLFVERRGHGVLADIEWGRSYYQDDEPVRSSSVLRGHAVRANYLASGAADLAVETGDEELLDALGRQWHATASRRTYITGGQGSHHQDEAFGDDHELPPDRAYSETCAGIASVQFSWRLLLARGGSEYADLIERTLFNVVATSPSRDGRAFYYANTLHQRRPGAPADPYEASVRASSSLRAPWFEVSCCPTNVARTFASLAAYLATKDAHGIQLHQFASSRITTVLASGQTIELSVETTYPDAGRIAIRVLESGPAPWTLSVRVPSWAAEPEVALQRADGTAKPSEKRVRDGYLELSATFARGDEIVLDFALPAHFVRADPRIDAVRGCLAVERGPLVYALESTDVPEQLHAADVSTLRLDAGVEPRVVGSDVQVRLISLTLSEGAWPYSSGPSGTGRIEGHWPVALTPYYDWAERGPSTMRVWIPVAG